jgi:hypothetical protein
LQEDGMTDLTPGDAALGSLVKEYRLSYKRVREIVLLMLFSLGMGLVCILPAVFSTDTSSNGLLTRTGTTLVGLFVMLPVFVGLGQLFRLRGSSLALYQHGLLYRSRGAQTSARWDQIQSLVSETACRITCKDGVVIEFGASVEGWEEVVDEVQTQTLECMLPAALEALRAGSSLEFKSLRPLGKAKIAQTALAANGFRLDQTGIASLDGAQRFAWEQVSDYGQMEGKLGRLPVPLFFVRSGETTLTARWGLLENVHLLLALCDQFARSVPSQGQG